jgi:hypothetical protein
MVWYSQVSTHKNKNKNIYYSNQWAHNRSKQIAYIDSYDRTSTCKYAYVDLNNLYVMSMFYY